MTTSPTPAADWVEWTGGENPVPGQMVDYRYRDSDKSHTFKSDLLHWQHDADSWSDIIAYRVVSPTPASAANSEAPSLSTHDHPDNPDMTHVPHLEQWAYNQMPKTGERDLRLMRYDGTDLYAWFGKFKNSVFEDLLSGPFLIKSRAQPHPSQPPVRHVDTYNDPVLIGLALQSAAREVVTILQSDDPLSVQEGALERLIAALERSQ